MDNAYFNAKYSAFYVIGRSAKNERITIGRPHPTVEAALAACKRLENGKRYAGQFLFIDSQPA